jgi:hypothetical protein
MRRTTTGKHRRPNRPPCDGPLPSMVTGDGTYEHAPSLVQKVNFPSWRSPTNVRGFVGAAWRLGEASVVAPGHPGRLALAATEEVAHHGGD